MANYVGSVDIHNVVKITKKIKELYDEEIGKFYALKLKVETEDENMFEITLFSDDKKVLENL